MSSHLPQDGNRSEPREKVPPALAVGIACAAFLPILLLKIGLDGPETRLAIGVAIGAALVGFGEAASRRGPWASGATATGFALLLVFGCLLAESRLIPAPAAYGFLGLIQAAAFLAALRLDEPVALVGLVLGLIAPFRTDDSFTIIPYVVLPTGALLLTTPPIPPWLASGTAFAAGWLMASSEALLTPIPSTAWFVTGLIAAALVALARLAPSPARFNYVWIGAGAATGLVDATRSPAGGMNVSAAGAALALGLLLAVGLAFRHHPLAATWEGAVPGVSATYLVAAMVLNGPGLPLATAALGFALLNLAVAALALRRPRRRLDQGGIGPTASLAAALGCLAIAVPLAIGEHVFAVAGALAAMAWAWAAARFGVPELRQLAATMALAVVAAAVVELPGLLALASSPAGRTWQLYSYGVPLLALAVAAAGAARRGSRPLAVLLAWCASALAFLLVRVATPLMTCGLSWLLLLLLAWPLAWRRREERRPVLGEPSP